MLNPIQTQTWRSRTEAELTLGPGNTERLLPCGRPALTTTNRHKPGGARVSQLQTVWARRHPSVLLSHGGQTDVLPGVNKKMQHCTESSSRSLADIPCHVFAVWRIHCSKDLMLVLIIIKLGKNVSLDVTNLQVVSLSSVFLSYMMSKSVCVCLHGVARGLPQ